MTTIPLPWDRPPLRANDRRGWQAQHRARSTASDAARWAIRAAKVIPIVGCEVTLNWRPTNNRRQDADGMYPTLKVAVDALVLEAVLPDDSWVCVPSMTCRIHPPSGEPAAMWLLLDSITHYDPDVTPVTKPSTTPTRTTGTGGGA